MGSLAKSTLVRAVSLHQPDRNAVWALAHERDSLVVVRPGRKEIVDVVARQLAPRRPIGAGDEDLAVVLSEHARKQERRPIRRPRRARGDLRGTLVPYRAA